MHKQWESSLLGLITVEKALLAISDSYFAYISKSKITFEIASGKQ
jgi:hypothetical protein